MASDGDFWLGMLVDPITTDQHSATSVLDSHGAGLWSSFDDSISPPPSSSTSSEGETSSAKARVKLEDDEVRAMLKDEEVRAVLKKVTISEAVLNKAIRSLGGGEKGLTSLMGYIMLWVKRQRDIKSSSQRHRQQQQPPQPPSNPVWNFSSPGEDAALESTMAVFHDVTGILQGPPSLQLLEQSECCRRLKSRKLGTRESEMPDGRYAPSSFVSIPLSSGACNPEMANFPGVTMDPFIFPLNHGMHAVAPFTTGHAAMMSSVAQQTPGTHAVTPFTSDPGGVIPSEAQQTAALAAKAARKRRQAQQRRSVYARAAGQVTKTTMTTTTTPVSGGYDSSSSTKEVNAVQSSGMLGAPSALQTAPFAAIAAREGRKEGLTELLRKPLRPSDVCTLARIILPKREAEQNMPFLKTGGGICIDMEDFESGHVWSIRYRFWANNKLRMYILENTGEFVSSNGLLEGDLLVIYRKQEGGFVLRGKKKTTTKPPMAPPSKPTKPTKKKKRQSGVDVVHPMGLQIAHRLAAGSLEEHRVEVVDPMEMTVAHRLAASSLEAHPPRTETGGGSAHASAAAAVWRRRSS